MPMVARGTGAFTKFRPLISGFSQMGKTYSLVSFLYGNYDYSIEPEEAVEYASGKTMVILTCPGEVGYKTLPPDTDQLCSFYQENDGSEDFRTVEYSRDALETHNAQFKEIEKNRPDIVWLDGGHGLYDHIFNSITDGEWLAGTDLNINIRTGQATDKYRGARLHDQAQKTFINYLNMYYNSPIPLLGMTVWEDWKTSQHEGDRPGGIDAPRYTWPALAGAMATKMPGKFDARLSARIEKRCIHKNCEYSKAGKEHYVWQFLPKNEVRGVGIKGLRASEAMMDRPYIHQTWPALQSLMKRV